jgi:hypothetical protein
MDQNYVSSEISKGVQYYISLKSVSWSTFRWHLQWTNSSATPFEFKPLYTVSGMLSMSANMLLLHSLVLGAPLY